jgi:hypothetical protein
VEDWSLLKEIMQAVKLAIPDAENKPAGEVLGYVRDALVKQNQS